MRLFASPVDAPSIGTAYSLYWLHLVCQSKICQVFWNIFYWFHSNPIKVCDNHRIYGHRVFSEYSKMGKSSMGWFYGFKLHLIINDEREILSFCLTSGNVDDRNEEVMDSLTKEIFGKFFAWPEQRKIWKISWRIYMTDWCFSNVLWLNL